MSHRSLSDLEFFDAVVVGGGPAGATAATDLVRAGHNVLLLDKAGRIKPCGGAIPPRLIRDFDIPDHLLCAKITSAQMVAPSEKRVDMPVGKGFVGMVDREVFDEFLRERAAFTGAQWRKGTFKTIERAEDGSPIVTYVPKDADTPVSIRTRVIIGADGARSAVGKQAVPGADKVKCVFAYHEIIKTDQLENAAYEPNRCDVYYQGKLSPDFYAWVFPHGKTASIGTGSANKGFSLRQSVADLRKEAGLADAELIRHEGAPIPLKPLKKWDNGKDVLLVGDAAGCVAPASGEGIYYAMVAGRNGAEAVSAFLRTNDARALAGARKAFMKEHGRVLWILGIMQYFWYTNDKRRERFVKMCEDKDVQRLTWESYMNKKIERKDPLAHFKIFLKDTAHLLGLASVKSSEKEHVS